MSINLIETIAQYDNICNYFHLPVQSGSNRILKLMNRNYQIENYIFLVKNIKNKIKNCAISTDIITGYPSETLADHNATISLLKEIRFSNAFMFRYSPREGTRAFKQIDDVPEDKKIRRLNEIITLQNSISKEENLKEINSIVEILVDNQSKKKPTNWFGKTKTSKVVVFENSSNCIKLGDVIKVRITKATSATLTGELVKE